MVQDVPPVSERDEAAVGQGSFTLPDGVDADKIIAQLAKGVLMVTLPKTAEAAKQKKIEVKKA